MQVVHTRGLARGLAIKGMKGREEEVDQSPFPFTASECTSVTAKSG